jgi:hypothetical protein
VLYLVTGFDGVSGYGKTIAMPFMMRTDFSTVFQTLPLICHGHFEANPPTFVNLVCDAARQMRPGILNNGDVFEGGIYMDPFKYGPMSADAKTLEERNMMEGCLRRDVWLTNIVNGTDLLTSVHFPADNEQQRKEIESLGGYGAEMDPMAATRLPILELRNLPEIRYGLFPAMAMDIFRYVFALNTLAHSGDPGQLQAIGLNERVHMVNDDPAVGRADRRAQIAAAIALVAAWGIGTGGD